MSQREMQLYTIYDSKGEVFFPPFADENNGSAIRQFGDLLTDPQSKLNKHAGDYKLYRIGRYRVDTGILYPEQPEELVDGMDFFTPTVVKEA